MPLTPSEEHVELLRFADRVRIANGLSDHDFWQAMNLAEQIEGLLGQQSGRIEASALAVAVWRCGMRARLRQASPSRGN